MQAIHEQDTPIPSFAPVIFDNFDKRARPRYFEDIPAY